MRMQNGKMQVGTLKTTDLPIDLTVAAGSQ
jgi:hypothetical protein